MSRVSAKSMPRRTSAGEDGERALRTAGAKRNDGPDEAGGMGRTARVLVVEDEALICVETADTLEHQGFEVHTASSGEDALARLRNGLAVDVLFTDVNLAGRMDGTALARNARELFPELIVVYTSGTVGKVAEAVAGSVFVPKPYTPALVGCLLSQLCTAEES